MTMPRGEHFGRIRRLLLLGCLLLLGLIPFAPAPKARAKPLVHSAYLWKQGWDAKTAQALAAAKLPQQLDALSVLVGECGLSSGRRAIHPPWELVLTHGKALSLSVRIGVRNALRLQDTVDLSEGVELLMDGLAEAKSAGVPVVSLQIDFDCPERLLFGYAAELRSVKSKTGLPVTITALPSWLDADGFEELIATADGWTLQLHGTERPRLGRDNRLFSARESVRWIEKAMRWNRPFRIALPTYAYVACFGHRGEYLGMHAEQSSFPSGTKKTVLLPADPVEVTSLLRILSDSRYEKVTGIDWFRLPLKGERQNWTMEGLTEVMAGRSLSSGLELITIQHDGLCDFSVRNPTDQPLPLPSLRVAWLEGDLIGGDATFAWTPRFGRLSMTFARHDFVEFLGPGECRVIGWLRLSRPQTITTRLMP